MTNFSRPLRRLQQPGRDGGGEREHRADRKVDAARQDHEVHAHRDDEQEGVVDQQVVDDLGLAKPV